MKFLLFYFFCHFFYLFSQDIYLPFPDSSSEPDMENLEKELFSEPEKKVEQKKEKPPPSFKKKKKKKKKEEVLVIDPSKALFEKALFYLKNGEIKQAKDFFQKTTETQGEYSQQAKIELAKLDKSPTLENESETNLEDDQKWKMLLEKAKSFHSSNPKESQSIYLDLILQAPEPYKSVSLIAIGNLMMEQEKWKDAKIYLLRFLKNYPNHTKKDLVLFLLGKVETELQNIPQAKKYYRMFQTKEFENSVYLPLVKDKLRNIEY